MSSLPHLDAFATAEDNAFRKLIGDFVDEEETMPVQALIDAMD